MVPAKIFHRGAELSMSSKHASLIYISLFIIDLALHFIIFFTLSLVTVYEALHSVNHILSTDLKKPMEGKQLRHGVHIQIIFIIIVIYRAQNLNLFFSEAFEGIQHNRHKYGDSDGNFQEQLQLLTIALVLFLGLQFLQGSLVIVEDLPLGIIEKLLCFLDHLICGLRFFLQQLIVKLVMIHHRAHRSSQRVVELSIYIFSD